MSNSPNGKRPQRPGHARPFWILLIVIICQNLAVKLIDLPLNRLIESRYCNDYYSGKDAPARDANGNIPEELCKVNIIQQNLAWLQGAIGTIHIACDMLVTIPLGALSDSGRRRVVLVLNIIGLSLMILSLMSIGFFSTLLPTRVLLLAPVFTLLGGADCVFMSTTVAVVTELAADAAEMASWLAYIGSASYVVTLLSPSIAAATMTWNLWLPFWLALALLILCLPLINNTPLDGQSRLTTPGGDQESAALLDQDHPSFKARNVKLHEPLRTHMQNALVRIFRLPHRPAFTLLLGTGFFAALASSNTVLLPQYISKRYSWTFANAGYLLSLKAALNVVLLTLVVPLIVKRLLQGGKRSASRFNTSAAICVLCVSVIGALLIAFSSTIWQLVLAFLVYALGSPLGVFTMSLVKHTADSGSQDAGSAQDYSAMMLFKTAGGLIGLPLMTSAWTTGMGLGGVAMGGPYFLSAFFYLPACFLIRRLRQQLDASDTDIMAP